MIYHGRRLSKLLLFIGLTYPQLSVAETFTSAEVLRWQESSQNALFQNSITMAGIVATQVRPSIAACINDWYGADEETGQMRYDEIREVLARFPEHHPQAIILAVVEKACGQFEE